MMAGNGSTPAAGILRWAEIAALASLAGLFAILSLWDPQGVDFFAVCFFLTGSLLIDARDIEAAHWTRRRPFVFACAALILAIPFVSAACSVNGFRSEVGSGVYTAAVAPALFLVASSARFRLADRRTVGRLILISLYAGFIPGAIYGFTFTEWHGFFYLPGQPALNIAAIFISIIMAVTLFIVAEETRTIRFAGYAGVLLLFIPGLLTGSRTFVASTGVVFVCYAVFVMRNKELRRELYAIAALLAGMSLISLVFWRSSTARLLEPKRLGFFDGRLGAWADALTLFKRYPACGIGPNTFYDVTRNPLYMERVQANVVFDDNYHAHNIYLNTIAEGGVLRGLLLLALIAATAYGCYRVLRANPNDAFGRIAATTFAVFLLVGTFEDTIVRPVMVPLAIFLGLALNVTWIKRRSPSRDAEPTSPSGAAASTA